MSSADHWQRVSAVFHAVVEAPSEDRRRLLDEACGGDAALRAELEALLAAHETPTAFLDRLPDPLIGGRLQRGDVLCDRFEVDRLLGSGGMGEVWAAHDRQLAEELAIKTVRPSFIADEVTLTRFRRELQLARRVAHPNICRVHDLFEDTTGGSRRAFLTMELVDGETLALRLKRDGAVPVAEALAIVQQIVSGLAAAHAANVVHRDLKPGNVMLTASPARRVVIMDFGLARLFDAASAADTTRTAITAVAGTPEYMAPEQISGGMVTALTDVYALGLILFEMLRGERPFGGGGTFDSWLRRARERPARLAGTVAGVDHRIDEVIARCLEYEPARRFQSVEEVWAALQRRRLPLLPRRGSTRIAAAAALAAAVIVVWQAGRWRTAIAPGAEAQRWYASAAEELANGAVIRALNSVTRAIEAAPAFALAHARHAEILMELDMPGRAQEAMLLASASPRPAALDGASYIKGLRELLLRDCDAALPSLQQYGHGGPAEERPYRLLSVARGYVRCGRPDEAQRVLAEASTLDPRNAAVLVQQALLFALNLEYGRALAGLDAAERLFQARTNMEGVCEVLVSRGTVQASRDDLAGASDTLSKALAIATSLDDVRQQVRARLQLAIVNRKRGDIDAAERLTTEAIDFAGRHGFETLTLEGLFANGNVHVVRNQFPAALLLFQTARGIADSNRHEEHRARAYLAMASVYVRIMEPDKAEQAISAARPYYERTRQTPYLIDADRLVARVHQMRAEYRALVTQFEASIEAARRAADHEQEIAAREGLAGARAALGDYPKALADYQRVLAAHRSSGRRRDEAYALLNLADTYSRMGRFADAAVALREVEAARPALEIQSVMYLWRAADALRQGKYANALADAARSREAGKQLSAERDARAHLVTCAAAAMLGRTSLAGSSCDAARAAGGVKASAPLWLEVQIVDAEVRLRLGRPDGVRTILEDAQRAVIRSESHADRWRVLALMAALPGGDRPQAQAAVTREIQDLRLLWGAETFDTWKLRPDVRALLDMAGMPKGD